MFVMPVVSIPQSGFGAFERGAGATHSLFCGRFQSLSRDSGRLNRSGWSVSLPAYQRVSIPQSGFGAFEPAQPVGAWADWALVSIPQSGFGAFEPEPRRMPSAADRAGFNPSVGIRGV